MSRFNRGGRPQVGNRGGFGVPAPAAQSSGFGPASKGSKNWEPLFVLDGIEVGASEYEYRNGNKAINLVIDPGPSVGRPLFVNYTVAEWLSKHGKEMFDKAVEMLKNATPTS